MRVWWWSVLLCACAVPGPAQVRPGQSEAELVQALGPPLARHVSPDGFDKRLEYNRGPGGRQAWMIDVDRDGRVRQVQQVLNERQFLNVKDGLTRAQVLALIGRPTHVAGMWRGGQIWSWRWATNDCLWFQVAFDSRGIAQGDGSYGPDPACDVNDRALQ